MTADTTANEKQAWSRIRIILPQTARSHVEQAKPSAVYLAMCDIGGMMGVYAGFSMITFAQALGYGVYILWWEWNRRHRAGLDLENVQA